jgi:HK97 family phage major capsid protein
MNRFEKRKLAIEKSMGEHADKFKAIYAKADEENRDPTQDERLEIEQNVKAIETLKEELVDVEQNIKTLDHVDQISTQFGGPPAPTLEHPAPRVTPGGDWGDRLAKSIGEQFVESGGFKKVQGTDRGQTFTSGAVEIDTKGTLLSTAGGGGAPLANLVPQVVPGVVDKLFQRLTVADLILSGQTDSPTLRYAVEGTATNAAAGVAEGGAKPESTLGLTSTDETVKKIATTLVVSDEMLEDAAQVQSYINGRLSLFVQIEEERQLLRGAGTNELVGIMAAARGINVYAGGTAAGNKAVQLFKAMNGQRGSALLEPDWIVINPTDWEAIRLATDDNGQYFGGGPFQGPYSGTGRNFAASNIVSGADEFLWNKPVVVTSALGSGTALVGTRSAAQVFRRSGLTVEATNSHSTYFTSNLVAIRAEQRLGLAVYRPAAFTDVRLS